MRLPRFVRSMVVLLVVAAAGVTAAAQAPATQTATQFYMAFREAFEKATKVEDILPYLAAEQRKEIEATPPGERPEMFGFIKMMMGGMTGMKVLKEDRAADGSVTLTVEAVDSDKAKVSGKISIIRESGAWKVGKESWSSSPS